MFHNVALLIGDIIDSGASSRFRKAGWVKLREQKAKEKVRRKASRKKSAATSKTGKSTKASSQGAQVEA
ncbi:unnamed protein product, partial [Mesorhabditis belari]|uniref:Uncharacterized protein n=1 Tax=Mesorhabditis belari TaxID=2138241 RepID=A0AAF3FEA3_9BILA